MQLPVNFQQLELIEELDGGLMVTLQKGYGDAHDDDDDDDGGGGGDDGDGDGVI